MRFFALLRDARFQSLTVIALLVLGSLVLIGDTLMTWRAEANALEVQEERTRLLEQKAVAATSLEQDPGSGDEGEGRVLIDAQTSGLVSAEFQRLLSSRAERAGAVVRAVDVPEDAFDDTGGQPTSDSLERVRLTADIEVMEQSLPDLLYAIEGGFPVMVVDALSLRLNRRIDLSGAEAAGGSSDRPLSVNVTLSAFRQKEPES